MIPTGPFSPPVAKEIQLFPYASIAKRGRGSGLSTCHPAWSVRGAMAETREIAPILADDVVGFSRMPSADEDRTLSAAEGAPRRPYRTHHLGPERPPIQAHRRRGFGRIPQRRRSCAVRHHNSESDDRAHRRNIGRSAHRVLHRHPYRRRRRGERRRHDGRQRQSPRGWRGSPSRVRSVCPSKPIGRRGAGSISP